MYAQEIATAMQTCLCKNSEIDGAMPLLLGKIQSCSIQRFAEIFGYSVENQSRFRQNDEVVYFLTKQSELTNNQS